MRAVRDRRDELNAEIGRLERALDEAGRVLDAASAAPRLAAVS